MSARGETHKANRRRMRKRLLALGVAPEEVDRLIDEKRQRQLLARSTGRAMPHTGHRRPVRVHPGYDDETRERIQSQTYARFDLDDSGYRPTNGDPLANGVARVTGQTAKAVRRSKAMTKWDYDQREARDA